MTQSNPEAQALIGQFLESLRTLPDVHADVARPEPADPTAGSNVVTIGLRIGGKSVVLLVGARKSVFPRDARQAMWQLQSLQHRYPADVLPVLIAESLSPGARELLRASRTGYFDRGGSLFLPAAGAYVYIDRPPPKAMARAVRSIFCGRRAQVLYAILARHEEWFGVTALANRAQVAPSTVADVLAGLEQFDWLETRGKGPRKERRLHEPGAVLDAWANEITTQRLPELQRYFVPGLKSDVLPERLGALFERHQVVYAVGHEAAAQRYAPFLTGIAQVRVRLMPGRSADAAIAALGARSVREGANLGVTHVQSAGALLFRQNVAGVWLDHPIQVYLDLLHAEGRARELAGHLRKERMGF